jgi:putative SOS response-associated peptidase YedK
VLQRPTAWRCVIFADGFYEWRQGKPYYFTLADEGAFAFAGLYEPRPGGAPACTIVTVPANALVAGTHDRMPAILPAESHEQWLRQGVMPPDEAASLLRAYESAAMRVRSASRRLNSARYDAPDVLVDNDPVQHSLFD